MDPLAMFVVGVVIMFLVVMLWPDGPDDKDHDKKGKHKK